MIKLKSLYNEIRLISNKKLDVIPRPSIHPNAYQVKLSIGDIYINKRENWVPKSSVNKIKREISWEINDDKPIDNIAKLIPVPFTKGYDEYDGIYWIKIEDKFINVLS